MKISNMVLVAGVCFAFSSGARSLTAQETSTAHAVVTVTTKSAEDLTNLPQQSITLQENRKTQPVTGWVPLRGPRAGLQLVVLLDDASRANLGLQLNELKNFLTALPPNVQVAVGYMRNGSPNLVQNFTTDHAQAAQALRLPVGSAGINGSPYFCLSALAKQWPGGRSNVRREVIMVTDGVDRYSGERRFDPRKSLCADGGPRRSESTHHRLFHLLPGRGPLRPRICSAPTPGRTTLPRSPARPGAKSTWRALATRYRSLPFSPTFSTNFRINMS